MRRNSRCVVFAHYDRDGFVDEYVLCYLRSLAEVSERIVFVTTGGISPADERRVLDVCWKVISRDNKGYDFLSYKYGIKLLESECYDELLLCNDSVYGPLTSLGQMFARMHAVPCDYWGITESYAHSWHLQSYFLVFRKNVVESQFFTEFWANVKVESTKRDVIDKYEVGLSRALRMAGFHGKAYVGYKPTIKELFSAYTKLITRRRFFSRMQRLVSDSTAGGKAQFKVPGKALWSVYRRLNPTHFFWRSTIRRAGMPFIKVELLRDNPENINISDYRCVIEKYCNYDAGIIERHLDRMKYSDRERKQ